MRQQFVFLHLFQVLNYGRLARFELNRGTLLRSVFAWRSIAESGRFRSLVIQSSTWLKFLLLEGCGKYLLNFLLVLLDLKLFQLVIGLILLLSLIVKGCESPIIVLLLDDLVNVLEFAVEVARLWLFIRHRSVH